MLTFYLQMSTQAILNRGNKQLIEFLNIEENFDSKFLEDQIF